MTGRLRRLLSIRWLKPGLAVVGVLLAAFLLYRALSNYSWDEIVSAMKAIPVERAGLAILFAALSYFCLSWFDWLALRYVQSDIPYRRSALASFVALSLGHNIGFAALSSGAIRYRYYSRWGVSAGDVAKIVVFCGVTVGLGLIALGGSACLLRAELTAKLLGISTSLAVMLGLLCLAAVGGYLALSLFLRRSITLAGTKVNMPPPELALAQIGIGTLNFACVGACLYHTIRGIRDVAYFEVVAAYVLSNAASLLVHAPGGLGVLETIMLHLLPGAIVLAALVLFRVIYYLLPLCFGVPLFALSEAMLGRERQAARKRSVKPT